MFTLAVKDFVMIAHSLRGSEFGPAQNVHGATLATTAELRVKALSPLDIVVDIGLFKKELRRVLERIDYQNLDSHAAFQKHRSTTERIAQFVADELASVLLGLGLDPESALRVVVDESPVAWVAFERPLRR
ncbi:MAG: 6-carboxytetrahydropterin synthase [Deltaproteobacteria bacterium]|nr:6-carboxytetrahydropterin synthase [Deltaproteobacteria bacterium]